MPTLVIRSLAEKEGACKLVMHRTKFPFTVKVTDGAPRSDKQNRLYHKWMKELSEQGDQTAQEYTALCKLTIGVPLLRAQDLEYKEFYDTYIKGREYAIKLKMMGEPYGFPVSSLMKTKQFVEYLNAIHETFTAQGFDLTDPEDQKFRGGEHAIQT